LEVLEEENQKVVLRPKVFLGSVLDLFGSTFFKDIVLSSSGPVMTDSMVLFDFLKKTEGLLATRVYLRERNSFFEIRGYEIK
jgi:hypothetical protein